MGISYDNMGYLANKITDKINQINLKKLEKKTNQK